VDSECWDKTGQTVPFTYNLSENSIGGLGWQQSSSKDVIVGMKN
jgi:hypothetical protein